MNNRQLAILAVAAAALWWLHQQPADGPCPGPDCPQPSPVNPTPCPGPGPCPAPKPKPDSKPRRPWLTEAGSPVGEQGATACKCCAPCKCDLGKCACRVLVGGRCSRSCECGPGAEASIEAKVGGNVAPDGKTEIQIDLPLELHRENVTSRGQGCCVFTSLHMAAQWQCVPALYEFPKWLQEKGLPGGGHPGNVKERITAICKERGVPEPDYIQVESSRDLEILKLAAKTGRMICGTYSKSPTGRYNGKPVSHMVCFPHFTDTDVACLDNNYVKSYEWMTPDDFLKICNPGGYWAVILLAPPPPPPPRNP